MLDNVDTSELEDEYDKIDAPSTVDTNQRVLRADSAHVNLRQTGTSNIIRQSFGDSAAILQKSVIGKAKAFDFDDDKSSDEDNSDLSFDKDQ